MQSVDQHLIRDFIERALQEDVGSGDHTSEACIPAEARCHARLLVKDYGIIAGVAMSRHILQYVDATATFTEHIADGSSVSNGDIVFEVECNTRALLKAERLLLNTMQRMSGIATLSNQFVFEVEDLPVTILDTRKTTPLIRFLEKWAVRLGGATNYRDGLYDRFMIKDNHVEACGGIREAIAKVEQYRAAQGLDLKITVEVRNLVELYAAMEAGAGKIDRIMLDNFDLPIMKEAVAIVDRKFEVEASGGVTLHTIRDIALTGVDFVSVGALTHHAQSLDLSLKITRNP